jgi:predicted dehydrogenase
MAAMKRGKHVVIHKPIANRIYEAKLTIETARKTGVVRICSHGAKEAETIL